MTDRLLRLQRPRNILLSRGCNKVKLCDFGMARTISLRMSLLQNTTCAWYCAPEGLLNHTRYTTASDMWSVGCILAEMILGRVFLRASSDAEQLHLIAATLGRPNDHDLAAMATDMVCLHCARCCLKRRKLVGGGSGRIGGASVRRWRLRGLGWSSSLLTLL